MAKAAIRKIVWSVDLEQKNEKIWGSTVNIIRALTRGAATQIKPAYVVVAGGTNVPGNILGPQLSSLRKQLTAELEEKLETLGPSRKFLAKPEIIFRSTYTARGAALALQEFAEQFKADLILVGTHGRRGVSRFFMGSFAESLLLVSAIPLLIVGESSRRIDRINHILYPTDLSEESRRAFAQVIQFAHEKKARITLLNIVESGARSPLPLTADPEGTGWRRRFLEGEISRRKDEIENLAERARRKGLTAAGQVSSTLRSPSQAILRWAQSLQVSLIAMAARSGPISSVLVGSTTRQVIRSSDCPVWAIHQRSFEMAKELAA